MPFTFKQTINLYRDSYTGHSREIWILVILTFINRSGTMVLPFLTIYLTTVLDFSLKEAGILASAFGIGSFVGAYIGGKLADRIGSIKVMIGSLFFSGIFFILLQYFREFNILFIMFMIAAIFGEAYRPAAMTYVAEHVSPEKRGRTMAFIRLAVNLGMSAGPLVGGFVATSLGYHWLFWLDGVTCILAAMYFTLMIKRMASGTTQSSEKKEEVDDHFAIPPYKNRNFLLFLLASFILGITFVQWFNSVPVFLKTEWGFDERYIGMMMAINTVLIVLFEMPLITELEKLNRIKFSVLLVSSS